jgi:hypothetical protein
MPSATHPESSKHQPDACGDQDGLERAVSDVLLDAVFDLLRFVFSMLKIIRDALAQLFEFFLCGVPRDFAHFLKIVGYVARFSAQLRAGRSISVSMTFRIGWSITGTHEVPFENERNPASRWLITN